MVRRTPGSDNSTRVFIGHWSFSIWRRVIGIRSLVLEQSPLTTWDLRVKIRLQMENERWKMTNDGLLDTLLTQTL